MTWRDEAACLGMETEIFFPVGVAGVAVTQLEEAKEVCAVCPVRPECLRWAVDAGAREGVWGGMSPEERRLWQRTSLARRHWRVLTS